MRRIAIQCLFFDRGKLVASLLGVALATTLAFVQIGLYRGFQTNSSTVIQHVGGDFWLIPTGIDVLDNAQAMSPGPRNLLLSHPCVADARAVIYGFALIQKPSGTRTTALIVAVEPRPGREVDRKSTRLNSSHITISYAVFCLKKKKKDKKTTPDSSTIGYITRD